MEIRIIFNFFRRNSVMIKRVVRLLNGAQNYYHFTYIETDSAVFETDAFKNNYSINWTTFCRTCQPPQNGYDIYITELPFDDNWFSHESYYFSVISIYDWERVYSPPSLKSYIIYQIAQSALYFKLKLNEETMRKIVHVNPKGCMFDFCQNKPDIKLGMVSGVICPECKSKLRQYGIQEAPINAIEKILYYVRQEAIGSPVEFNANAAFIVMPFAKNTESDHAYLYGIKPALQKLGIECIMGRENVQSIQILEQIFSSIKNNRFVIIQVDNDNLNVYFELGVAMGMEKDVLLISRPEFVKQIPADLTNWECLTYETGKYEELKNKIIAYYQNNYHY